MRRYGAAVLMLAITLTSTAAATPALPADGLVAYWGMDDSLSDLSGYGHDGTAVGGAAFAPGVFGSALSLDGTDDFVGTAGNIGISGNAARTVAGWFNLSAPAHNASTLLSWGEVATNNLSALAINIASSNAPSFWGTYNDLRGTVEPEVGVWYHAAFTFDGETMRVYVNGTLDIESAMTLSTVDTSVLIGAVSDGAYRPFQGLLDDLAIWNRALTPDEIAQIASSPVPEPTVLGMALAVLIGVLVRRGRWS